MIISCTAWVVNSYRDHLLFIRGVLLPRVGMVLGLLRVFSSGLVHSTVILVETGQGMATGSIQAT